MDFHEMEAFVALARQQNFGRAAQTVHASPSALSRLIARLEQELGAALVLRGPRQTELTEAGRAFLSFCEESLARRDALHLLIGSADGRLRGTLRVYASVTACYSILPPLAERLRQDHPELKLSVQTGDPAEAEAVLRGGTVDVAVAALSEGGRDFPAFSVQRTPLVFVAAGDGAYGALAGAPEDVARRWLAHPFILPARGLARERFDRWARQQGLKPRLAAETSGNEAVLALTRLGLGLGVVPRLVLENSPFAAGLVQYEADGALGDYDIGFLLSPRLAGSLGPLLEGVYSSGRWQG